jgi:UDP-N-acetyl-2-amino-2-deoxyglucuronate dehydrogenase
MAHANVRLGIVGTGIVVARRHIPALAELKSRGLDAFTVPAVCDTDRASAESAAQELERHLGLRPTIYTDYHDMLNSGQVDGVDLCLPHGLHHTVAEDCMESGVHVLCEKPLGITIRASQQMVEAANRTGCVLSTAVPFRRLIGQRTAHWVLNQSGMIGKPLVFFHQGVRARRPPPQGNQPVPPAMVWRRDRLMSGGGGVMDSGFHYCDSIRYLLGDVDKIYAEARALGSGDPQPLSEAREDTVCITFTLKSGVIGMWSWGMALTGPASCNVIFYGSQGSISDTTGSFFHLFWRDPITGLIESGQVTKEDGTTLTLQQAEEMYLQTLSEDQKEFYFPHGLNDGFGHEIWEFIELIRGNREKPEVDGMEGLRSLAICEAIYESAFTGQVVQVDDVISGQSRSYQAQIDEHWGL